MMLKKLLSFAICSALLTGTIYAPISASAYEAPAECSASSETTDSPERERETIEYPDASSHSEDRSPEIISGKCGGSVSFALFESGTLFIYGSGPMTDYSENRGTEAPYRSRAGSVRRIVVEPGVTTVGSEAFMSMTDAGEILLPDGLETIGTSAFLSCTDLSEISIPSSVTVIGEYAIGFKQSIRDDEYTTYRIKIIGDEGSAAQTYADEKNFRFISRNPDSDTQTDTETASQTGVTTGKCGENAAYKYDHDTGIVTISGTGDMYDYESYSYYDELESSPFKDHSDIKKVVIEDGITSVGNSAFENCSSLSSVTLPGTIRSIGSYAFAGNYTYTYDKKKSHLRSIDLPEGLESIGMCAFRYTPLESLTIPSTLFQLHSDAFSGCSELKAINCAPGNRLFSSENGSLYEGDGKTLYFLAVDPEEHCCEIPEGIETVMSDALVRLSGNFDLKAVVFPESVKSMSSDTLNYVENTAFIVFKGSLPHNGPWDISLPWYASVYCSFSDPYWKRYMEEYESNVKWYDLDVYEDTLTLKADEIEVSAGDFASFGVYKMPYHIDTPVWSVGDESVARVLDNGALYGVKAGTTTVTAASPDGKYSASAKVTVTGELNDIKDGQIIKVDYGVQPAEEGWDDIERSDVYGEYPCSSLGGVFAIISNTLNFYSFTTGKTTMLRSFPNKAYFDGRKLYAVDEAICLIFDTETLSFSEIRLDGMEDYSGNSAGADKAGRLFVSAYSKTSDKQKLFVFTPDGKLLDSVTTLYPITRFSGFLDDGRFFTEVEDLSSYAYSVSLALTAWKFSGGKLCELQAESRQKNRYPDSEPVLYNCLYYIGTCSDSCAVTKLLDDRYLVTTSFFSEKMAVFDCSFDGLPEKIYEEEYRPTRNEEYISESDKDCYYDIPYRSTFDRFHGAVVGCGDPFRLVEFDKEFSSVDSSTRAHNYVWDLYGYSDMILIKEKTKDSALFEAVKWDTDSLNISAIPENETMKVGQCQDISLFGLGRFSFEGRWTSSDSTVASVTDSGRLASWKAGDVTVTFTTNNGKYSVPCNVRVLPREGVADSVVNADNTEAVRYNKGNQNYGTWSAPVCSYLFEDPNGRFTRAEYFYDHDSDAGCVLVVVYSKELKQISSKKLVMELPFFGGIYSGSKYNYIVTGQANNEESDECEVYRVSRYTKNWELVDYASAFGEDTYVPFEAGSLRMTECGGKLYIHTCHLMYQSGDGLHHQSNYSFIAYDDPETNKLTLRSGHFGYSSHSFNQFVVSDGKSVFSVDHGDAYPRAVSLKRVASEEDVSYFNDGVNLLDIKGEIGDNWTGVSVGGAALSTNNCLVVGNSIDMSNEENVCRNIFLSVADKETLNNRLIWITNFNSNDVDLSTPHIVKLSDEQFLIMWDRYDFVQRYDSEWGYNYIETTVSLCTAAVDGSGNVVCTRSYPDMCLSDCPPIFASDGTVKWYVTGDGKTQFFSIDPFKAEEGMIGDLDYDKSVTSADALSVLRCSVGAENFSQQQILLADIDEDSTVTSADALDILRFSVGFAASERIGKPL